MAPDAERPTHLLHRLTSYTPEREWTEVPDDDRLVQDLVPNDVTRRPRSYKRYDDDLRRVLLPPDLPASSSAATAVLAGTATVAPSRLDLPGLARLLFLSSGVTRRTARPDGGVMLFRAAGSAGARFPLELYVAVPRGAGVEGLEPGLHWYDPEAHALVGAGRVHEFPVALVALGPGDPAVHLTGDPMSGHHDADGLEFPLVTAAQRAGEQRGLGAELERGGPVALTAEGGPSTDAVVVSKGSIRRLHPDRSLPRHVLVDAMSASLRGIDVPHWLGVSGVDDVPTGIHRWPDLSSPVRPLDERSVRDELFAAALEQGLAGDAAFVAMSGAPLDDLDDHAYREAQLLAGVAEGRLHLMAYALGAAASGMTFRDSDLAHLLGADVAGLLWTCVGVPEYRTRPSGQPGSPADVTIVWPRWPPSAGQCHP